MSRVIDLNSTPFPRDVPRLLRQAAQDYREAASELQSAWQDPDASMIWNDFAKELDDSAEHMSHLLKSRGLA